MQIKQAVFVTSMAGDEDFSGRGLSQIAVAGKSNVGKSSLINCLTNQKKLARTSQQPGRTQLLNIFLINEQWHLVDLPGYGFAKVPKHVKEEWQKLMHGYLKNSQELVGMLHLVDIRHEPGDHDKTMATWIQEVGIPCVTVATKADKLSKMQQQKSVARIAKALNVPTSEIVPFSSVTKQGKDELLSRMEEILLATSKATG